MIERNKERTGKNMPLKNKEKRNAALSFIVMAAGMLCAVFPFLLSEYPSDRQLAVAFAGIATAITALFIFMMYKSRAEAYDRILSGSETLAHFYYPAGSADDRFGGAAPDGAGPVIGSFIGAIFAVTGFALYLSDSRENGSFFILMLVLAGFFVLTGFAASFAEKRRYRNTLHEAVIAKEGLYFKNTFYTWNDRRFSYLESVSRHPAEENSLLFCLRRVGRNRLNPVWRQPLMVTVPVPEGQEGAADYIVSYFGLPMADKKSARILKDKK